MKNKNLLINKNVRVIKKESAIYKRVFRGYNPIRIYNNLTKKNAFELELEVYKRVSGKEGFPKLIKYDEKELSLSLEHCGKSLNMMKEISVKNLEEQIDNICNILEENEIIHLDLNICDGCKNICYKEGKIYLIDFDICVLDKKPLNELLRKKYLVKKDVDFRDLIMKIIKKKLKFLRNEI